MKRKLLPRTRLKTMCAVCGVVLQFFLSSELRAENKKTSTNKDWNTPNAKDYETKRSQDKVITGKITD